MRLFLRAVFTSELLARLFAFLAANLVILVGSIRHLQITVSPLTSYGPICQWRRGLFFPWR